MSHHPTTDDLAPARGCLLAVLIGSLMWVGIITTLIWHQRAKAAREQESGRTIYTNLAQ